MKWLAERDSRAGQGRAGTGMRRKVTKRMGGGEDGKVEAAVASEPGWRSFESQHWDMICRSQQRGRDGEKEKWQRRHANLQCSVQHGEETRTRQNEIVRME